MLLPMLLFVSYSVIVSLLVAPVAVKSPTWERVNRVLGTTQKAVSFPYPVPAMRVRMMALAVGGMLALPLIIFLPPVFALLPFPIAYILVVSRYVSGWPNGLLKSMEAELPSLTSFVLELSGMGTLPVPTALLIYADKFPERPLSKLVQRTPHGGDPVAFLLERGIPSVAVSGVLSILDKAQQNPKRKDVLKKMYEAQETRMNLELERVIEGRVSKAPVATVLLLFPALLATALVPVMVRFMALLGGM